MDPLPGRTPKGLFNSESLLRALSDSNHSHISRERVWCNPGMVVHAYNPATQEAEAGRAMSVGGHPGLHSEVKSV